MIIERMLELIILNKIVENHLNNNSMIDRYNELYNEFIEQYYVSKPDSKEY
nr:MAG TPA: hypothetical protein [Bacteriophage sp.]